MRLAAFPSHQNTLHAAFSPTGEVINHRNWVAAAAFSPDDTHLLTLSQDPREESVWDLRGPNAMAVDLEPHAW